MPENEHSRRRFKLKAGEYDWYKEQVASDKEFVAKLKRLATRRARSYPQHNSPLIRRLIAGLADDYDLSTDDIDELLVTVIQGASRQSRKGSIGFDLLTRQATVTYNIDDCSDKEAEELFRKSLAARRRDFGDPKAPRRRLPQEAELLYAIHRAVKRGLKRQAIFDLYAASELTGSKPNLVQFSTPVDLMNYYYRHTEEVT
ncbi:MAG: hypothetical protein ACREGA_00180 [Candidatus Saccharimonadales bacterium]